MKYDETQVWQSYMRSPYRATKPASYFLTYADLLSKYQMKQIIFLEVGVLNGGSLFMWRDFFGNDARIIGVDMNPLAKRFEKYGFEIYIGDQSDESFWNYIFKTIGPVDIVLDDGGHTYLQQMVTVDKCVANIEDGGLMIVEDVHTSYFSEFGYPYLKSFVFYAKQMVDIVNQRFPGVKKSGKKRYRDSIYSVRFYESIVAFEIDKNKCIENFSTENIGVTLDSEDYRYYSKPIKRYLHIIDWMSKSLLYRKLKKIKPIYRIVSKVHEHINKKFTSLTSLQDRKKIKKYL